MKFQVIVVLALAGLAVTTRLQKRSLGMASNSSAIISSMGTVALRASPLALFNDNGDAKKGERYGNPKCPCIGIDKIPGKTLAIISSNGEIAEHEYPGDLGARCNDWDDGYHPKCKDGDDPSWCSSEWCYVDPCHCDIPEHPKLSTYIPYAESRARPVYYSYATCGAVDSFTATENKEACPNQKTEAKCKSFEKCAWSGKDCMGKEILTICESTTFHPKQSIWGQDECKCIGIYNQVGETDVMIDGKHYPYPADTGAICKSWDDEEHPSCTGESKKPDWCLKKWCYVDPCACNIEVDPKPTEYVPTAVYRGRPLYYSYATCGETDSFTGSKKNTKGIDKHCGKSMAWAPAPLSFVLLTVGLALWQ